MLPHFIPRSKPALNDSHPVPMPDLTHVLEQHVQAGFPPDLALDLVLNELVVRAADATHACAAALALVRGDEMVCRAATGVHAPDLGIPLNTRDGLSGACVRTRLSQLCNDTESDSRVDPDASRRLGIRSILIVPVMEPASNKAEDDIFHADLHDDELANDTSPDLASEGATRSDERKGEPSTGLHNVSEIRPHQLAGVLEVFSPLPNAFSPAAELVLGDFARECARIRSAASRLRARPPVEFVAREDESTPANVELIPPASVANDLPPALERITQPYQAWTLVLAALLILAAATLSFLIGSRVGWLRSPQPVATQPTANSQPAKPASASSSSPVPVKSATVSHTPTSAKKNAAPQPRPHSTDEGPASNSNDLVVYEKGKVVFRMPSSHDSALDRAAAQGASSKNLSPPNLGIALPNTVWLAPDEAESRLLNRVEPQYPADAIAAHRSGDVTLEIHVASDGSVSSVQTVSGDPLLAAAAAQAVRNWRYQPYRQHEQPSPFQTDVTLTFSLPN